MRTRPRIVANDVEAEKSLSEPVVAALAQTELRYDLEHLIGELIELLDDVDGDPDREPSADDEEEAQE